MPAYQFDSSSADPQYGGGGGLPLGRHPVVIAGSALKPTKDGQGGFMELIIQAIDGPAKGLSTVDRLNLHNKSAQAVEIANKQLSAYCHVTGVYRFQATEELHGKPFIVEMVPRSDNPNQTEIGKIFDVNGNEPGKAGSGGQPQGGNAGAFGGQPPAQGGQPQGGQPQGGAWGNQQPQADQGGGNAGAWGNQGGGQPQGGAPAGGQPGWSQNQGGAAPAGGQPAWGAR